MGKLEKLGKLGKLHQQKFYWQKTLGTVVVALGAMISLGNPAKAIEPIRESFELAQVGVTSRIKPPTPLNLRPRTHIPLPESNYRRSRKTRSRSDRYRGGDDYGRRSHRRSNRHSHRHSEDCNHYSHRRGDRRRNDRVIIINPGGQSRYNNSRSNSSGNYIRIIGR